MYQCHQKKKKKRKYMKYYNFFCTNKENKKKNRLIKDKVQIENANMRIIKWLQQFHNKNYVKSC